MIFFIPTMAIVIALILVGSIQPGGFLAVLGWFSFIAGMIFLVLYLKEKDYGDYHGYRVWAPLFLVGAVLLWIFGGWFGDHSLFEFLFGTGWF